MPIRRSATLLTVAFLIVSLLCLSACNDIISTGVRSMTFTLASEECCTLSILYVDCRAYSISYVGEDRTFLCGETYESLDEHLPGAQIHVRLYDCDVSDAFLNDYAPREVHTLKAETPDIRVLWSHNADHGLDIFIASDRPLTVDEHEYSILRVPTGTILVTIGMTP